MASRTHIESQLGIRLVVLVYNKQHSPLTMAKNSLKRPFIYCAGLG